MALLRQYEVWELGNDGYPFAWHGRCTCDHLAVVEDDFCVYDACSGDTPAIKDVIREEAQNRCERCWHPYTKGEGEWSRCDQTCKHGGEGRWRFTSGEDIWKHTQYLDHTAILWTPDIVVQGRYRILTVHHLDEDKANCRWWNLVALCQRCHLSMQRRVVMDRPYLYEHSEWFKPYAAAFYAFKYLGEDLDRAEVMARLEDLLKLEYRFDQGVLL